MALGGRSHLIRRVNLMSQGDIKTYPLGILKL